MQAAPRRILAPQRRPGQSGPNCQQVGELRVFVVPSMGLMSKSFQIVLLYILECFVWASGYALSA